MLLLIFNVKTYKPINNKSVLTAPLFCILFYFPFFSSANHNLLYLNIFKFS